MFESLQKNIKRSLLNMPGWHTKRKILVIESDDWGSIRMPSKQVYDDFLKRGIRVDKDPYCRYDSLATSQDLEALFNLLTKFRDSNGRNVVLTANSLMANPDFERIKASGFNQYFYEPFTKTLERNASTQNSFELWKQGINAGIFKPQFHGREHVYVKNWLQALQEKHKTICLSFELGTFGLTSLADPSIKRDYMGALNSGMEDDIISFNEILEDGLAIFEQLIGYKSVSFIPTTYTWHPDIEVSLKKCGVEYLQGMIHQRIPVDDNESFRYKKNNYLGNTSNAGLYYLTRNAYFEPAQVSNNFDVLGDCLHAIKTAFRFKKPAILSMHRLNIIGAIDETNRKVNLDLLGKLLSTVIKTYPDIEFMSSDELGNLVKK